MPFRKKFVTTGAKYKSTAKKGNSYKPLDSKIKNWIENLEGARPNGVFCTPVDEPVPTHEKAGCEIVYPGLQSPHNTWIVLGRDRPESLASGAGGEGQTQCGMIDIVVGKASSVSAKRHTGVQGPGGELDKNDLVGPNFNSDAARIYLTQRTSEKLGGIDAYLGLPEFRGGASGDKSAIAIKSDHTRIIGREAVRIYAGSSKTVENSPLPLGGETCANGERLEAPRIELICNHSENLQPAVLGNNLKKHLNDIHDALRDCALVHKDIYVQLGWINGYIAWKTKGLGPWIKHNIDDVIGHIDSFRWAIDLTIQEINDLDKAFIPGANSIFSNTVFIT